MNQRETRGIFRLLLSAAPALALACSNTPSGSQGSPASAGSAGQAATTAGSSGASGNAGATAGGGGSSAGTNAGGAGQSGGGAGGAGQTGGSAGAGSGGGGAGGAGAGGGGASGGGGGGAAGTGGATGTGCKGAAVCYDFEECATPAGWTVPKFPGGEGNMGAGTLLVDKEKAHGGMCSLHMKDFSGDQPQHAFLADLPKNFGGTLWGRAWVFNTATPQQHGALIKTRYAIPNSTDQDWYEVGYEKHIYQGIWHNPLPPSGLPEWVLSSPLTIAIGAWTCVEWLFDAKNGDMPEAADPRIWADGVEAVLGNGYSYDLTNGKGTTRPPHPKGSDFVGIEVGLTMYHPIEQVTNIYLDDLAFGQERIGCGP